MTTGTTDGFKNVLAQFIGQPRKPVFFEGAQVRGIVDPLEQGRLVSVCHEFIWVGARDGRPVRTRG